MIRRLLVLAAVFLPLLGLGGWLATRSLQEPLNLPEDGYLLDVPSGSSLRSVANRLEAEGILSSPLALVAYGRISGLASGLKAGEYEIAPGTSPLGLLKQLVEGIVKLHSFTIIEGWTTRDLLAAIRDNPIIRKTELTQDHDTLARGLELPSPSPEGWFLPDTYRFPRGTPDRDLLGMAYERMQEALAAAWEGRDPGLPLKTPYEALIMASIIEKETSLDRERARIAGVFIRRLKKGMRLQTDPTIIYGLGAEFDGNLRRNDLTRDTPYNTYTRAGLPPSPIAMPRESSLHAAVHPDDSSALYFVASGNADRSHIFSATLAEHNAAVRRYLAATRSNQR